MIAIILYAFSVVQGLSRVTPLEIATSRLSCTSPPPCPRTSLILVQASQPWSPFTHMLYGPTYREDTWKVMLIW